MDMTSCAFDTEALTRRFLAHIFDTYQVIEHLHERNDPTWMVPLTSASQKDFAPEGYA